MYSFKEGLVFIGLRKVAVYRFKEGLVFIGLRKGWCL